MQPPSFSESIIELHDVAKRYTVGGSEIEILKCVSLQVNAGEFVAIVGPSGSGKSTLLNMITGIDRPSAGEVVVLGQPVHKLSENGLARWRGQCVGIIFQFFQLLPALTLLKNVILPMDLAGKYSASASAVPARSTCSTWSGWPTRRTSCPAWSAAANSSAPPSCAPLPMTRR